MGRNDILAESGGGGKMSGFFPSFLPRQLGSTPGPWQAKFPAQTWVRAACQPQSSGWYSDEVTGEPWTGVPKSMAKIQVDGVVDLTASAPDTNFVFTNGGELLVSRGPSDPTQPFSQLLYHCESANLAWYLQQHQHLVLFFWLPMASLTS